MAFLCFEELMDTFFTSDTHFYHGNIIKMCGRPWIRNGDLDDSGEWVSREIKDARTLEMNEALIAKWNSVVGAEDTVYHLGDFSFGKNLKKIRDRLNGKIHLVLGNHDRKNTVINAGFESVKSGLLITEIDGFFFVLNHRPLALDLLPSRPHVHLHGHCHGCPSPSPRYSSVDVGVDVHNFLPISIEEIFSILDERWMRCED
jgi:calcineurin-like phosphoesterase family protein